MRPLLPVVLLATASLAAPPVGDEATRALDRNRAAQTASERRAAALVEQRDRGAASVARADAEGIRLTRELGEAQADVRSARVRVQAAVRAEQAQAARVSETRAPLAGMTAALARIARRPPALALANGASVADAAHLALLIRHLRERVAAQNAALAEELGRRTALRQERVRAVAALVASRRLLDQRRQLLVQSRLDLVERTAILADAADAERERARGLAEEGVALGSAIGSSRRARELAARLAELPGPVPRPVATVAKRRMGSGLYRLPETGRVLSGTGERDADGVRARGLTLATDPGLPVEAPAAGRVLYAGPFRAYGDIVILDHGHGWTSLVAGLSRTSLELGTTIAQGAPIGRSTRRLLIELRHGGQPVDVVAVAVALR